MDFRNITQWIGRNDTSFYNLMFCLTVVWILPGIFPLVSYEGDAMSICYGCEFTADNGWQTLGWEGYGFWMQPLTYIFLTACRCIFDFDCEPVYTAVSAGCALLLIYISVLFCHKLTGLNKSLLLVAILLIPESYELAMYPNSMAPAALLALTGFLLLAEERKFASTIALCIAPLIRLDVCVIYPVVPLMLYMNNRSIGKCMMHTCILAVTVIITVLAVYGALGASITTTLKEFALWTGRISEGAHFSALIGFYGLITPFLIPIGLAGMVKHRQMAITLIVATACIIIHAINFRFGNASKHYTLLLPYVAIINAFALRLLYCNSNHVIKWGYTALITACCLIGIYIFKNPYYGKFGMGIDPLMLKKEILKFNITTHEHPLEFSLRFGPGSLIATGDELYSIGGYLYYPYVIHKVKTMISENARTLKSEILPLEINVIMAPQWNDYTRIQLENQRSGANKEIRMFDLSTDIRQPDGFWKAVGNLERLLDSYSQKNEPLVFYLTTPLSYEYRMVLDEVHRRDRRFLKTDCGVYILANSNE